MFFKLSRAPLDVFPYVEHDGKVERNGKEQ